MAKRAIETGALSGKLYTKATEEESREKAILSEEEKERRAERRSTIDKIVFNDGEKNKQISAKVNDKLYKAFTQINKIQGLSNNSAMNMLMIKYVRENREILEKDSIY